MYSARLFVFEKNINLLLRGGGWLCVDVVVCAFMSHNQNASTVFLSINLSGVISERGRASWAGLAGQLARVS